MVSFRWSESEYENKQIFLSGTSGPTYEFSTSNLSYRAFVPRCMLFWMNFFMFKQILSSSITPQQAFAAAVLIAGSVVTSYPDDELWMHNSIFNESPT